MRILIAPDKFKNSLSSLQACEALKRGVLKANENCSVKILPLADGGDGLSEVIQYYTSAESHTVEVSDPLFRQIKSSLLIAKDGKSAFIEMAKASGLMLLKPEEYNCMQTSTTGTGEMIKEAIRLGAETIILGLGGSATNDCGTGMASALGFKFLDQKGAPLKPTGENLGMIEQIESSEVIDISHLKFIIACDVTNPLTGITGATMVYAQQKGASTADIEYMEHGMKHFASIIRKDLSKEIEMIPGSGAAGGLGAGCIAFLNASLQSGIDMLLKLSEAEKHIQQADVVFTGEGKIDTQSLNGKVLSGISALCKKHNKPLIAFCGKLELRNDQLEEANISVVHCINPKDISLQEAYKQAPELLADAAFKVVKNL